MKPKRITLVLEVTTLLVSSTTMRLALQEKPERIGHDLGYVRYRLVDLGR